MATVAFSSVGKVFPDGTRAVDDLDLEIADGEFMVLVGPSGCGKTTALRMVAGLEDVTDGEILIGDRVVNDLEPRERDISMVFQNYALYPHMSVFDNIAFGLRMQKVPRGRIEERVREISRVLGIDSLLRRKPRQLSGGQRQRVAMGRAIVRSPAVFLMDEPLSNLDARLRVQMRAEIARIQHELGATTIYVTHDQVEAMTMGDRVAVLRKGVLQQTDGPQRVYDAPANLFVASFIGSPAMNLVEATLEARNGGFTARVGTQDVELSPEIMASRPALAGYAGRKLGLGIRPEHVREAGRDGVPVRLRGKVLVSEALGAEQLVHIEVDAVPVVTQEVLEVAGDMDAAVVEVLQAEALNSRTMLVARFDSSSVTRAGEPVEVAFAPDKAHFFDLDSGRAIDS
ncbi:MAG: sn-glycerol-3-phosphate ABC transporter ATP-binding protein UgpC [Actinomycetota bacterium]|nr:sn-glycerol-3-phosphate ABC transporter ATP-binding protein UgpC [Actinomycetota bacterium]